MWNRAFFQSMRVRDGAIADFTYEEPFASLIGFTQGSTVDLNRVWFHDIAEPRKWTKGMLFQLVASLREQLTDLMERSRTRPREQDGPP
jgi:hypothetical protein